MAMDELAQSMLELEEEKVLSLVKEYVEKGTSPLEIVKSLQDGMTEIGNRFEKGEYFLSELVMAGEIMQEAMEILEPHLAKEQGEEKGTIVIGTVKGDIHDLGKNIVVMLLKGSGYNVIDLGVDVPAEKFAETIKETKAPLVGMSVLLTSCQESMKEAIEAVRKTGIPTKVIIGGNYVNEKVKDYVGADYFAFSAADGVKVAREIFGT